MPIITRSFEVGMPSDPFLCGVPADDPDGGKRTCSYTKFGIIVASNAFVYTNTKTPHFCESGNEGFLLVEALPLSPQDTSLCPGNAGKIQRLRDFANR